MSDSGAIRQSKMELFVTVAYFGMIVGTCPDAERVRFASAPDAERAILSQFYFEISR